MAIHAQLPAFKAPFLSREKAMFQNALCIRAQLWHSAFGGGEAVWSTLPAAPVFTPACLVELRLGGQLWLASFSDISFLLRHEAFAGYVEEMDIDALPASVRRAVLESLFSPAHTALQNALNTVIAVQDVRFGKEAQSEALQKAPFSFGFRIDFTGDAALPDESVFAVLAPVQAYDALEAAELIRALPRSEDGFLRKALMDVPLEVAFESGYISLRLTETAALCTGDVLIPEVWTANDDILTLRVAQSSQSSLSARCRWENGAAVLVDTLSEDLEPSMDSTEQNDIDIRLSFELDRRLITVGELASLAPGYTFSMNCDMQTPVTIRANGKAIAKGRLVDMDGVLGVQLTETLTK